MIDIFSVDYRTAVRKVVCQRLKQECNIKIHKFKDGKLKESSDDSSVFGGLLSKIPNRIVNNNKDTSCSVPCFLIDACEFLLPHLSAEGLFRKSGSIGRQKVLKDHLGAGNSCFNTEYALPHDVAALVKLFFRELKEPLIDQRVTAALLKCFHAEHKSKDQKYIFLLSILLLLPDESLATLQYFSLFIKKMTMHAKESKMTLSNLAIVFAPNFFAQTEGKDTKSQKSMKEFTEITEIIFRNASKVAQVPEPIINQAIILAEEGSQECASSGDELEDDSVKLSNTRKGRSVAREDSNKRTRSSSITGFVKGLRGKKDDGSTPNKTRRSISAYGSPRNYNKLSKYASDEKLPTPGENRPKQSGKKRRSPTERKRGKTGLSPVRKSPRLQNQNMITGPTLTTLPNQLVMTPRKHLKQIQVMSEATDETDTPVRTPVIRKPSLKERVALPDKFAITTPKRPTSVIETQIRTPVVRNNSLQVPLKHSPDENSMMDMSKSFIDSSLVDPPIIDDRMFPTPNLSRSTHKPEIKRNASVTKPVYIDGKRVTTSKDENAAPVFAPTSVIMSTFMDTTSTSLASQKLACSPSVGRRLPLTPYSTTPQVGSGIPRLIRPAGDAAASSPPKFDLL